MEFQLDVQKFKAVCRQHLRHHQIGKAIGVERSTATRKMAKPQSRLAVDEFFAICSLLKRSGVDCELNDFIIET